MAKKKNTFKNVIVGISLFILVIGGASAIKSCSEDKLPSIGGSSENINSSEDIPTEDSGTTEDGGSEDIPTEDSGTTEDGGSEDIPTEDSGTTEDGSSEDIPTEDSCTTEDGGSTDNDFVSEHHFTLVGSLNNWDVTNNDYLFVTTDDIEFVLDDVSLNYGDEFKIVNHNGWEWSYNINNVVEASRNLIDGYSSDNIVMRSSGVYDIVLNIGNHTITFNSN